MHVIDTLYIDCNRLLQIVLELDNFIEEIARRLVRICHRRL